MKQFILCVLFAIAARCIHAQVYTGQIRTIEPYACPIKIDSTIKAECGYLVVPENRQKNNGKTIRLPFMIVRSNNKNKAQDPLLYTAGGPGGSSLRWASGAAQRTILNDRDCIAFEQRGTYFAQPFLWSNELSDAIRESYRKNLNKDSMMLVGTTNLKKALQAKGIDLSGYNTDETVADIHDLLATLHIDSVNLTGGSYSGGLMLAVLQKNPAKIRSLVLDSPLPTFVPIDEDEPVNFMEALHTLFMRVETDSTDIAYAHLEQRFTNYFTSIAHKTFYIPYVEKGSTDTLHVAYTKNDLLEIINNNFGKRLPSIILQIISGNHTALITKRLDGIFNGSAGPSGMRISVYCADQAIYHREEMLQQIATLYPFLTDYHINDVYKAMCDCWTVPPISKKTKLPFYSDKPALLADGEMDNACRPIYIDMIHHYLPNSQRMRYLNRPHMVINGNEWDTLVREFLNHPFDKLSTKSGEIVIY